VIPAKPATESKIRLLLADRQQKSSTVYTDGFRAYEPLEEDDDPLVNTSSTVTVSTLMETFT